jgi:hypothetical protein
MSTNNLKRKARAEEEEDNQPLKKTATLHSDDEDSDDGLQVRANSKHAFFCAKFTTKIGNS